MRKLLKRRPRHLWRWATLLLVSLVLAACRHGGGGY